MSLMDAKYATSKLLVLLVLVAIIFYYTLTSSSTDDSVNSRFLINDSLADTSDLSVNSKPPDEAKNAYTPCTFGLFREYQRRHHFIPSGGTWIEDDHGDFNYQPGICKYNHSMDRGGSLRTCLKAGNVSYVVNLGDSNGGQTFEGLVSLLRPLSACTKGRAEHGDRPSVEYMSFYNRSLEPFLEVRRRFCRSMCASREVVCRWKGDGRKLMLEHLAITMILDDSVQLAIPDTEYYGDHVANTWALTSQEFLLKYYLKRRYPEVLIVTLPFNHDKNFALERIKYDLEFFIGLVKTYVPKYTRVFYLPTFQEFESRKTIAKWRDRTFEGMTPSDKIDKINHLLYSTLEADILNRSSRTYGFLDLWNMSAYREDWSKDGMHMQPKWYLKVMNMFWETFCNSLYENDF